MSGTFQGLTAANEAEEEARRKEAKRIRVSSYGGFDGGFSLRGVTAEEAHMLEGMVENRFWVSVNEDGRLVKYNKLNDVPGPTDDEQMMPFWNPAVSGQVQLELPLLSKMSAHQYPGLQIQGLGAGLRFSPDGYTREADRLTSFGFECLRSRRKEDDGRFWEIWNLSDFIFAQGELKELIQKHKALGIHDQLEQVIRFLCRKVSFGSLDVKWQVAALSYD